MEALGMESGEIHSDHITASSQYSTNWSSERSRLNYPENGWTPGEDSFREWIQVCCIRPDAFRVGDDLGHPKRLLKKSNICPMPSDEKRRPMGNTSLYGIIKSQWHSVRAEQAQAISLKICMSSQILTYDSSQNLSTDVSLWSH